MIDPTKIKQIEGATYYVTAEPTPEEISQFPLPVNFKIVDPVSKTYTLVSYKADGERLVPECGNAPSGSSGVWDFTVPEPHIVDYNFDITASWDSISGFPPVIDQTSFESFLASRSWNYVNDFTNIVVTDFNLDQFNGRLQCNLEANGTTLELSNMGISELNSIGNVIGLKTIIMYNSTISNFNPIIAFPDSLETLEIDCSLSPAFNPDLGLPLNLRKFRFIADSLVEFNPTFSLPSTLEELQLERTLLLEFNPSIALPSNLKTLRLSTNPLTKFNPDNMLPISLTYLDLGSTNIDLAGWQVSETWATAQPSFTDNCQIETRSLSDSIAGTNCETILQSKNTTIYAY